MSTTKSKPAGIYLNGQALNLDDMIDIEIINEAFTFHHIHTPLRERGFKPRALRRSAVRIIDPKTMQVVKEILKS